MEAAGLTNVRVLWARAEDAGQAPALRQAHDLAIARAVAELRVLAELCLPLVRRGGHWVAAKGPSPADEVAAAGPAIGRLGGRLLGVHEVDSGGRWGCSAQRRAVLLCCALSGWSSLADGALTSRHSTSAAEPSVRPTARPPILPV